MDSSCFSLCYSSRPFFKFFDGVIPVSSFSCFPNFLGSLLWIFFFSILLKISSRFFKVILVFFFFNSSEILSGTSTRVPFRIPPEIPEETQNEILEILPFTFQHFSTHLFRNPLKNNF